MRLRTAFAAFVVLGVLLFVGVRSASAQDGARLWIGASVLIPSGAWGGEVAIDSHPHEFHGTTMSILVGGGVGEAHSDVTGNVGAGLKWSWKMNDKCKYFAAFLAGVVWHPDPFGETTAGFGMTPAGGITYKMTDKMDFFAMVGLGLLTSDGNTHVNTQVSGGITIPFKH